MRFQRIDDPLAFVDRVWQFVTEKVERNIIGTLLLDVRAGRFDDVEPLLAAGLEDHDNVAWVGIRVPPFYLLTSDLDPASAGQLVDWWLEVDPDLNGVDGPPGAAGAIAAAWAERTGGRTRVRLSEAMHVLEQVVDPPHGVARGALRVASEADREMLIEWTLAFHEEVGLPSSDRDRVARGVDIRTVRGGMLLWEDGDPVALVGVSPAVAAVARIGPVYTPPAVRGRGYASSAVAEASRRALAAGAERCMLFTDVANPTSNKIYADVGYRRIGAWEQHTIAAP